MRAIFSLIMLSAGLTIVSADIVSGNGRVESERRTVAAFSSINVSGSGTLRVHRGGQRVELTCDSNILPYITTSVAGDELSIGFKPFTSILHVTKLQFDVTLPELEGLLVTGSGDAYVDAFKGRAFKAGVSGSGGVKADLDYGTIELRCTGSGGFDATVKAGRLDLRCTGSGEAYLRGSADRAEFTISGSGALGARNFEAAEARVIISGSGAAELRVSKSLDALLSGSGGFKYWGNPQINQRVSGSGRIYKAGDR
jgi:hypothetical protein